jgi:hypothetical protein
MPDCKTCKEQRQTIPYIAHEADMARQERTIKRLWIVVLLLIVMLVGTNCAWLYYESQFSDEVTTIEAEQESESGNNYAVGGDYSG